MPRRLAQQLMALSDLECLKLASSASRAISAVTQLLVIDIRYDTVLKHLTFVWRFLSVGDVYSIGVFVYSGVFNSHSSQAHSA